MDSSSLTPDPVEIEHKLRTATLRKVELRPEGFQCRLIRLNSHDYRRLVRNSFPIKEDHAFYYGIMRAYRCEELTLNLAEALVTLEMLFGKSSRDYDDDKGSFSFPLFLHLQKGSGAYPYLLTIQDYKGSLEFNLCRIIDSKDQSIERDVYHEPLNGEFSREEISYFLDYLYGYLQGYFESAGKAATVRPFVRKIDACLGVYGYQDGEYFEEFYDTEEEYEAAVNLLEKSGSPRP